MTRDQLREEIFQVNEKTFEVLALKIFHYQFSSNEVYRSYCELIGKKESAVQKLDEIPFLPIEFFKTHRISSGNFSQQKIFLSSGTTGQQPSKHEVQDLKLYEESFLRSFKIFFGAPEEFCFLGLLPSYLERSDSSLVYMLEELMKRSAHELNGFYLHNYSALHEKLVELEEAQQKTILMGVTFALLDFADKFPIALQHTVIMETGGMKGRREEMTREEVHRTLQFSFHTKSICSEYGMTELLSQAYSLSDGRFQTPPWMKILIRDVNDPFQVTGKKSSGAINIIDLANLDSCSFLATADLGKMNDDGTFEVQGRMDYSDVRGCNLMFDL